MQLFARTSCPASTYTQKKVARHFLRAQRLWRATSTTAFPARFSEPAPPADDPLAELSPLAADCRALPPIAGVRTHTSPSIAAASCREMPPSTTAPLSPLRESGRGEGVTTMRGSLPRKHVTLSPNAVSPCMPTACKQVASERVTWARIVPATARPLRLTRSPCPDPSGNGDGAQQSRIPQENPRTSRRQKNPSGVHAK
jgi:hypothetical protein